MKIYFDRALRTGVSLAAATGLAGLLLTGCSSLQPQFDAKGIPAQRYYVGGGFEIHYNAPATGTAIVVEQTTQRVWKTETVNEGDAFDFQIQADDSDLHQRLGQSASEAKFALYFVPAKPKKENKE